MKYVLYVFLLLFVFADSFAQESVTPGIGSKAPEFELMDEEGNLHKLSDYTDNTRVVLFFYPKAGTSGCTKQVCGMRDNLISFNDIDVTVFGISVDPMEEIKNFSKEHELNFTLLSDPDKKVTTEYGVLRDNGMAKRVTFIIERDGTIVNIVEVKDVSTHASDILNLLKN